MKFIAKIREFTAKLFLMRGNNIPLEDFPSLFEMQGHAGASGVFFSGLWFGLATFFIPDLWTKGGPSLIIMAVVIIVIFFGLLYASFSAVGYVVKQLSELHKSTTEGSDWGPAERAEWRRVLDRRVRIWMFLLSGAYVVVCSVLIWLTGGAISPFTPFYVMIFTLTITKIKVSKPGIGKWVLGYFLIAIVVACILAEVHPTPIDGAAIRQSGFQIGMHLLFISASLVVPTLSQQRVELREAKVSKARRAEAAV